MVPWLQEPADYSADSPAARGKILQTDPVQLSELLSRLSQLQVKPHQQWLQEVLEALQPHLTSLSTAQLSSNLQVLGGWGFMPPEPFMQELHAAVHLQLGSMPMRHIAGNTSTTVLPTDNVALDFWVATQPPGQHQDTHPSRFPG